MDHNVDNHNSLWQAIKESIIHIIKTENSSTGGKLNLLFGIIATLFLFACFVPSLIVVFLQWLNPNVSLGLPWYVLVLMFFGVLVYFIKCVKYVDEINELKSKLK